MMLMEKLRDLKKFGCYSPQLVVIDSFSGRTVRYLKVEKLAQLEKLFVCSFLSHCVLSQQESTGKIKFYHFYCVQKRSKPPQMNNKAFKLFSTFLISARFLSRFFNLA